MAKFDFNAFDAALSKQDTARQAQIDAQQATQEAQAAIPAQVDPNLPAAPQQAPVAAQALPSAAVQGEQDPNISAGNVIPQETSGFNIDDFLGRSAEPTQPDLRSGLEPKPEQIESVPGDTPQEIPAIFADQDAMRLLDELRDEIPTAAARPQVRTSGPSFSGVGVNVASKERQTSELAAARKIRDLGFTDEDIASALSFKRAALPTSKKIQQTAGTIAGIAIPVAINAIPGLAAAPEEIITVPLVARTLAKMGLRAGGVGAAGALGAVGDVIADPDKDLTLENAFEAAKSGLIEEGVTEGIFSGVELGIGRMFGRSGRMATENLDELNALLSQSAKRQGITQNLNLPPGMASQLPGSQVVEAIAESSLFGANPVAKTKALIRKSAASLVNELPETFANGASKLSSRSVTNAVQEVLEGNISFHKQAAQSVYDMAFSKIDEAGAKLIDVATTVATPAGKILSETGEPIVKAGTKEVIESVPRAKFLADLSAVKGVGDKLTAEFAEAQGFGFEGKVKSLIEKASAVDETTTVRGIQKMRSEMLSLQRDLTSSVNPNSSLLSVVNELTPVLDKTMKSAADAASGDAKRLLNRANDMWRSNAEKFDNEVISSILGKAANTNPEAVFDILNSADEQQVKQLINGLTRKRGGKEFVDRKAMEKIQGGYLAGMISKVTPEDAFKASGKGEAVGDILLKRFNEMPDQVRNQLFKKSEQKDIINKFRLLSLSQLKGSKGLVGLKVAQTLGIVGIAAAPFSGKQKSKVNAASSLLTFGPSVLAGLMLRQPGFMRLLAEGGTLKATSREGIKVAGRLAKMVINERKRITKQRGNIEKAQEVRGFERKAKELGARDE